MQSSALLADATVLDRSIVHMAPTANLLGLVRTLRGGGGINLATVGASVAQAGGCLAQPAKRCMQYRGVDKLWNPVPPHQGFVRIKGFLVRLFEEINTTWPSGGHRLYNGAADATPSAMLAECLFSHIPRLSHLVVLEFGSMAKSCTAESIEAIVRALLDSPSPPAIVFLSVREWVHRSKAANMTFWVGAYDGTDQPWALCGLMPTGPGHHGINTWQGLNEPTAWSYMHPGMHTCTHAYTHTCIHACILWQGLNEPTAWSHAEAYFLQICRY